MEEKTKNIIYSVIAILLGLIVGGCTQVRADTTINLDFYFNNNLDYVYTNDNGQIDLIITNARYPLNTTNVNPSYGWVRYCDSIKGTNFTNMQTIDSGVYGKPVQVKWADTTTKCTITYGDGTQYTGTEKVISWQWDFEDGYYCYVDLDNGGNRCDIYMHLRWNQILGGKVEKIRWGLTGSFYYPPDGVESDTDLILDKMNEILNQGKFEKPTKDEILSDYDEKEEELWEIIGVPNYNNINIDIDENTNSKIWNLIVYILRQNTAILTMVVTILSISILKLILNR